MTATNTGDVPLTGIAVEDFAFQGTGKLADRTCPVNELAALSPGETLVCTATYTVTEQDVLLGWLGHGSGTVLTDRDPVLPVLLGANAPR